MNHDNGLNDLVVEQQRTIERLEARLNQLEARIEEPNNYRAETPSRSRPTIGATSLTSEATGMSRRRMLSGAAAALGGGLLLVKGAQPAAAASGNPVLLGLTNDANAVTALANTTGTSPITVLQVTNSSVGPLAQGISGTADGASDSAGVVGSSNAGYGLYGFSTRGYALFAGGNGRIGFNSHLASGPPVAGGYGLGDVIRDGAGNLFACVVAGSPGTWRKLTGPQTAGTFHLLAPSVRAVDSRNTGGLLTDATRTIALAVAGIPTTATAISANLTITQSGPNGYAALYAPAAGYQGTSSINWSASGTTIANGVIVGVSAQSVAILVSGSCQFILDVIGFWA